MSDATVATTTGSATIVSAGANTDAWKYRRRFMLAITAFCMAVIVLCIFYAKDTLGEIIVGSAFATLTSIFGFYVCGAVWDDSSIRKNNTQLVVAAKGQTT